MDNKFMKDFIEFLNELETNVTEEEECCEGKCKTEIEDGRFIIEVEGMGMPSRIHTNLEVAEKEAERLTRKEGKKVYLYKARTVFSPGKIKIENL